MHAIAHGGVWTLQESALKVDSGRKISHCTGESNLPQQRAGLTLYQLSYIPASSVCATLDFPSGGKWLKFPMTVILNWNQQMAEISHGNSSNWNKQTKIFASIVCSSFLCQFQVLITPLSVAHLVSVISCYACRSYLCT